MASPVLISEQEVQMNTSIKSTDWFKAQAPLPDTPNPTPHVIIVTRLPLKNAQEKRTAAINDDLIQIGIPYYCPRCNKHHVGPCQGI